MEIFNIVNVRMVEKEDINFLFNSFIRCLTGYQKELFLGWKHKDLTDYLEYLLIWVLNQSDYSVFIASLKEDSSHIIGYIIANSSTNEIFFQYTKYGYRKLGVQKLLLMPLCIKDDEMVTINWATKEMLRVITKDPTKFTIKQQYIMNLFKKVTTN